MTDDIDEIDEIDTEPDAAPEPASPPPGDKIGRDVDEAIGQQLAAKGHPDPYAGLEGRQDVAPGGRYEELAPFEAEARRNGTTITAAVKDYVQVEQVLRKDPIAGAEYIWQRLGVDPRAAAAQMYNRHFGPHANHYAQAAAQQGQQNQINAEVSAFARNPKNEHFDALRLTMVQLVQSGRATTLDGAYRMALKGNPTLDAKAMMKREFEKIDAAKRSVRTGRRR